MNDTGLLRRFTADHDEVAASQRSARALELSENAARMRIEHAPEKLWQQLGRRGITSTAVARGCASTGSSGRSIYS